MRVVQPTTKPYKKRLVVTVEHVELFAPALEHVVPVAWRGAVAPRYVEALLVR